MKKIVTCILSLLIASTVYAGDQHNFGQGHLVTYTVVNTSGTPISNLSCYLTVKRMYDSKYLDWNDGGFKLSGWTTLNHPMYYDTTGGFYWSILTVDQTNVISSDYACVVSVDNVAGTAGYGNQATEVVDFDETNRLIRIQR